MSKKRTDYFGKHQPPRPPAKKISTLYDMMEDGREYGSLIGAEGKVDLASELRRTLADIEAIRKRPAVIYAANMVKPPKDVSTAIELSDNLPFAEMIAQIPVGTTGVDIIIETPGGTAQQVAQFVDRVRPRFQDVSFIIPHMAMSAGTIWALSGNEIWMDERAFLGPIDPQAPTKDGSLVPYQTILTLLKRIQDTGADALSKGQQPPWTDIQILHNIDPKEIGNAIAHTEYATKLAAKLLETHKFRDWTETETKKEAVTPARKAERAKEVADILCSHDQWKLHGHGISRQAAIDEVRLRIERPEAVAGLARAIRRLAAVLRWSFENGPIGKLMLSQNYALFRSGTR